VCVEGCPVKALGEQSGESTSQGGKHSGRKGTRETVGGYGHERQEIQRPTDSGTAARFFQQFPGEDDLLEPVETSVDARVLRGDCLERPI
jgi:hypothetical protein